MIFSHAPSVRIMPVVPNERPFCSRPTAFGRAIFFFFFFFFFCCKGMNIAHSFFSALSDFLSASFLAFSLLLRLLSL